MFEHIKTRTVGSNKYELLFNKEYGNYQVYKNSVIQFAGNYVDAENQFNNLTQRWGS